MTKHETKQLLMMLEQFYPNKKFKNPVAFFAAWALALEPYDYAEIKAAAVAHSAKKKFFPDIQDLTACLIEQNTLPPKQEIIRDDATLMRELLDNRNDSPKDQWPESERMQSTCENARGDNNA